MAGHREDATDGAKGAGTEEVVAKSGDDLTTRKVPEVTKKWLHIPDFKSVDANGQLNQMWVYIGGEVDAEMVSRGLRRRMLQLYDLFVGLHGRHVDYTALRRSNEFAEYVRSSSLLQRVNPSALALRGRAAFFINLYNIMVLHGNAVFGPPEGLRARSRFFSRVSYRVGPYRFSLDDIEHGVLRCNKKRPMAFSAQFGDEDERRVLCMPTLDPRLHFALVCGAKSCPPIRVYHEANLEDGLVAAARTFLSDPSNFNLDFNSGTVTLSKLFSWYRKDFGADDRAVLRWCAPYVPDTLREGIEWLLGMREGFLLTQAGCKTLYRGKPPKLKFQFSPYDWALNGS